MVTPKKPKKGPSPATAAGKPDIRAVLDSQVLLANEVKAMAQRLQELQDKIDQLVQQSYQMVEVNAQLRQQLDDARASEGEVTEIGEQLDEATAHLRQALEGQGQGLDQDADQGQGQERSRTAPRIAPEGQGGPTAGQRPSAGQRPPAGQKFPPPPLRGRAGAIERARQEEERQRAAGQGGEQR